MQESDRVSQIIPLVHAACGGMQVPLMKTLFDMQTQALMELSQIWPPMQGLAMQNTLVHTVVEGHSQAQVF